MTFVTPKNPKTSHARVRSNFARVLEWSYGVVVLRGSGESEIVDSSSTLWVVGEHRTSNATAEHNFLRLYQPYLSFTSALSQSCLGLISTALKQGLAIAKGIFAFERRSLPTCDSKSKIRNLNTERQARIWV